MNLRQSTMHTGGVKPKPSSPRPSVPPGLSIVGARPQHPSPVEVRKQDNQDGSYSFIAYALDGTPLPDVHITESQFNAITEQKEQYLSISYMNDGRPFQNRAARRKEKFGKSSKGDVLL